MLKAYSRTDSWQNQGSSIRSNQDNIYSGSGGLENSDESFLGEQHTASISEEITEMQNQEQDKDVEQESEGEESKSLDGHN